MHGVAYLVSAFREGARALKQPRPTAAAVLAQRRLKDALARRRSRNCVDRLEMRPDAPSRITDLRRELARTGAGADPRLAHLASELLAALGAAESLEQRQAHVERRNARTTSPRPATKGICSSRGAARRQAVRMAGHFMARPKIAMPASYFELRARVRVSGPPPSAPGIVSGPRRSIDRASKEASIRARAAVVVEPPIDFEFRAPPLWPRILGIAGCVIVGALFGVMYPGSGSGQDRSDPRQARHIKAVIADEPGFVAATALLGYVPDELSRASEALILDDAIEVRGRLPNAQATKAVRQRRIREDSEVSELVDAVLASR